jgi:hypothetical protein
VEDSGWPKVLRRDKGGFKGRGVELESGWGGWVGKLQIEVWAGGLGVGPSAPMRELLGGGTELDEGGGTTTAQRVPGAGGGELAKDTVERGSTGQGVGGEVRAEEGKPAADERRGRAPAYGSVPLGGMDSEAGRSKGGGSEGGGFADAEEVDERHEEEPIKGRIEVEVQVGGKELLEGAPGTLGRRGQSGESRDSEPARAEEGGSVWEARGGKCESRQKSACGTRARGI